MSKPNIGQGDNGMTSLLGGGEKVPKDSLQVEAYGALDELVSFLGLIKSRNTMPTGRQAKHETGNKTAEIYNLLETIQDHLFRIASHVSVSPKFIASAGILPYIGPEHIKFLEDAIREYEKDLPELQNFILPGGTELAAFLHIARTEARRVERRLVALSRETKLHPQAIPYVNRLSDVFFVLARRADHEAGVEEIKWVGLGKKDI